MGVEINVNYEGELRCTATHAPSQKTLTTDAPVDNHGKGESFSPTDLVGTALGTCMLTLMGIVAERHKWDLTGTKVRVLKEMIQQPVRRIGKLTVVISVPAAKGERLAPADRTRLETAALQCPVHKSLHPDIETPITFDYNG
jgi:putative redox protein